MERSTFLLSAAVALTPLVVASSTEIPMKSIAGIAVPDTDLANEATSIAKAALPPEIFNHSLRTYLFSQLIAKTKKIDHDVEVVYVAAILHDSGMSAAHMSDARPFEVDGAFVVRDLLAKHGVSDARMDAAWDAVALHDNGSIAVHKQPEVRLVASGVGADFGAYLDLMTRDQIVAILAAAPRTKFIEAFLDASAVVAKKKPMASSHSFVADVGYKRVPGFSLPNFVDEVLSGDPFAEYEH
ncbi:MAG TPA: HD domain-containing protein [Candidatus Eremiobacteraceae bacterium]|jgi:hypothetical protein